MEMLIWNVVEDTIPLNQWDGDIYNEKDQDLNNFNVSRPYKMVKRPTTREKDAKTQTKTDKEKRVILLAAEECCKQDCLQCVDRKVIVDDKMFQRNPLSNALLDTSIYSKCRVHKDDFLSHGRS